MGRLILQTKQLTKIYKRTRVIDKVNMIIERGDIYGFIGLNGAGKSTFFRMVAGLTDPSSGSLQLFGETDRRGLLEARRRIGTFGVGEIPSNESLIHLGKTLALTICLPVGIVSIVMIFSTVATNNGVAPLLSLAFYLIFHSGVNLLSRQYKIFATID